MVQSCQATPSHRHNRHSPLRERPQVPNDEVDCHLAGQGKVGRWGKGTGALVRRALWAVVQAQAATASQQALPHGECLRVCMQSHAG